MHSEKLYLTNIVAGKNWLGLFLLLLLSGCWPDTTAVPTLIPTLPAIPLAETALPQATTTPAETTTDSPEAPGSSEAPSSGESPGSSEPALTRPYGYTYQRPDGNRLVAGRGTLPVLAPLDIPLEGRPQWVTAVPLAVGVLWGVTLADGRTQAFLVDGREVTTIASNALTPGIIPVMTVDPVQGLAIFLYPPTTDPNGSNPVIYNNAGHIAHSNPAGELLLVNAGEILARPALTTLPDARILFDEHGRLLLLTDPTDNDVAPFAAASISLLETTPGVRIAAHIAMHEPQVALGNMPLWADWDGDGRREIIVALSAAATRAQIGLFDEEGTQLAGGALQGQHQWHLPAIAHFGPDGEMEVAAVSALESGGLIAFFQWQGDQLPLVAQLSGYGWPGHNRPSADMAIAGDFNGDGRVELLLPTTDFRQLGGIQRTAEGAAAVYHVEIDGELATNLAGVTMGTGETAVALGRADNTLRIWQP